nr:retrovirus-related Pol polyprotein from transposon TNT 1-94 [Tanacetum cinerariifolium]
SVVTSRYPPTNNQLRTSSNPRQQATINNGRVTIQPIQNSSSPALHDDLILSVIEQIKTQFVNCTKINQDNKNVNEFLTVELERYKDQKEESQNIDRELALEKQEKVLVITALKETLSKLKGKVIVNEAVTLHPIDPELLKIDVAPLALKLRRTFTLVGNVCPLTRITTTAIVPLKEPIPIENNTDKPVVTLVYSRKTKAAKKKVPVSNSKINQSLLINFVQKFLGTVKFGNDHVAKIMGYGDYKIGNVTISMVYFVEGLGHNLFLVGQFCDSDIEVAFRQHTCFIRNLDGVDLLTGSRGNNLYTLSLQDMMASSPICLLSKASKTKSWLWHRRLSHLNFGAINHLARQGLIRGLLKHKFEKDHLCSACAMGKKSVNGKKYILVIVDDYSRFTWVKFLRSKDEASDVIIKFLKMIQVRLKVPVHRLVQKPCSSTPYVPPSINDWDLLFQSMFDELLNPPPSVDPQAPEVIAPITEVIPPIQVESTSLPSLNSVDQDAPSPSKSQTTPETKSAIIPQDVEEDNIDIKVAHMGNDPLFGVPIPEVTSAQ